MSTLAASNPFYSLDDSPPKPSSPVTPTGQYTGPQQTIVARSFMNLNPEVRGQHAPFPITPTTTTTSSPHISLEPPAGMSFADYLKTWSDTQTARWLAECKCSHHAETFKANDIRGDILLELDQATLKEMGIASIGDRLRMLNAVKSLRHRASNRSPAPTSAPTRHTEPGSSNQPKIDSTTTSRPHTKRPAPLRLNDTHGQNDLPAIAREQPPDSARSNIVPGFRPLPQPGQQSNQSLGASFNGSSIAHPNTPSHPRSHLPPLPPPPRGGPPPLPPGRRAGQWVTTPTQEAPPSYTSGSLPPAPQQNQLLTPSSNNWTGSYHSPADPRPANAGSKIPSRSTSPLPARGIRPNANNPVHGRNGSGSLVSPSTASNPLNKLPPRPSTTGTNVHPYANPQATALQPPPGYPIHSLSPIEEQFNTSQSTSGNPSPPSQYPPGRGPFHSNSGSSSGQPPLSLDEIRRKLVKFVLPDEGLMYTIDAVTCTGGVEVLEKVLKKFGKGGSRAIDGDAPLEHSVTPQGGLTVDGWGVYLDFGQQDGPGKFHLSSF